MDKGVARLARKAGIAMPKSLNGLSKHWLEAEKLEKDAAKAIVKAKRVKVALKELDAALRS